MLKSLSMADLQGFLDQGLSMADISRKLVHGHKVVKEMRPLLSPEYRLKAKNNARKNQRRSPIGTVNYDNKKRHRFLEHGYYSKIKPL